jgi:hypothetical protein
MIRRLYLVLTVPWALFALWGGSTRASGINGSDLGIAAGPALIGWMLWVAGRFVATGSFRRRETR